MPQRPIYEKNNINRQHKKTYNRNKIHYCPNPQNSPKSRIKSNIRDNPNVRYNPNAGTNLNVRRKKYKKRKRRIKKNLYLFILTIIITISVILRINLVPSSSITDSTINNKTNNSNNLSINCINNVTNDSAYVNKYYIYGTHFNIEGSLQIPNNSKIKKLDLILRNSNGKETKYPLKYEPCNNLVSFKTSDIINDGINLEDIHKGKYFVLIKATYDNNSEYYSLTNKTTYSNLDYYTITKENKNNKINIDFCNDNKSSYLKINVKETKLPKDVYDIVIDAGHGGTDTGATYKNYTEAEFTIKYAKALKSSLENLGLKVKLTRDGTESSDKPMAFTMYDDDGRINIAQKSKAKYCLSLHLNSNKQQLENGGVQVYCNANMDTEFAENIADNVVRYTDMTYSNMKSHNVANGVYIRNYTEQEITSFNASARNKGFSPYDITTDTNYYFMVRELGGIATNAYIDGRNPKYGKNNYYNSNIGLESYLLEMGYITMNRDLNIIINQQNEYVEALTKSIAKEIGIN